MKVLVTGANGQVGRALYKVFKENNNYSVLFAMREQSLKGFCRDMGDRSRAECISLDITEENAVKQAVFAFKPDIIINCAAHTAVDLCEAEVERAYQLNVAAVSYLSKAAQEIEAKFVHLSTDYVFEGNSKQPYTETDATHPVTVYGQTKLQGEAEAVKYCKRTFIIRTAWVYGDGKNFVRTMLRLAETHEVIRVVGDQYGSPTSASELARVILRVMTSQKYGIYHATCEGSTTWYGLAKEIFDYRYLKTGKKVQLEQITSNEYITPAKRPAYSVLSNKRLKEEFSYSLKPWKEALHDYLQKDIQEVIK